MAQSHVQLILDASQPVNALKKVNAESKKFSNAIKKTNGQLGGTGKKAKEAALGTTFLGKASKSASAGVKALGGAVKSAMLPLLGITAVIGTATKVFNSLAQQDFAEAKFRTLGGNSDELTGRLKLLTHELQGQTSTLELTKASYDVASAGFIDAADATQILKASSLGATGGFTDLNTVSGATVKVLNAYGKSADQAGFLVDQFAQTQADGIITIGEYSQNIGKVASTAAGLKVPLREVNAVIAQSTGAGVRAETAFTGLNAALAQIASGKVGKDLGVDINAASLEADGLEKTLAKLQGFGTGELQKAFGIEGFKALAPILNDMEKFQTLIANQQNAQGQAARAAFVASDTINGSLKRLGTAITNLFTDGSEVGEVLKLLIKALAVTFETLGVAIKIAVAPFRALWQIASAFFKEINVGQGTMQAWTEGWFAFLKGIDVGFQKAQIAMEAFGAGVGGLAESMKVPFKDSFDWILSKVNAFWNALPSWVKWSVKAMEKAATMAMPGLGAVQMISDISGSDFFKETDQTKKRSAEQRQVNQELERGKILTQEIGALWKDVGQTIGQNISGAIKGLIKGTQTLGQALNNILGSIADKLLDAGINMLLSAVLPKGVASFLFPRAAGGPVQRGQPYRVGERGPEMFVPSGSGRIIPNNGIGGGTTINVTVNTSGANVEGEGQGAELGKMLASAIQQQLVREQMPGGLLA